MDGLLYGREVDRFPARKRLEALATYSGWGEGEGEWVELINGPV